MMSSRFQQSTFFDLIWPKNPHLTSTLCCMLWWMCTDTGPLRLQDPTFSKQIKQLIVHSKYFIPCTKKNWNSFRRPIDQKLSTGFQSYLNFIFINFELMSNIFRQFCCKEEENERKNRYSTIYDGSIFICFRWFAGLDSQQFLFSLQPKMHAIGISGFETNEM